MKIVREESTNYFSDRGSGEPFYRIWIPLPEGESVSHQNLPSVVYVDQPTTFNMPEGFAVDSIV